jgi:ribosomal protein S18 acetylase RimI-like enzyme
MTEIHAFPLHVRDLIQLQLELECKRIIEDNILVRLPCPHPDGIPRFLVLQYGQSYTAYFSQDVSLSMREQFATLSLEQAFSDHQRVQALLSTDTPCKHFWQGKSYIFPSTLTADLYPDAVQLDDAQHLHLLQSYEHWKSVGNKTVYGIIVDGHIVASCGSVRENDKCAEAWVITEPAFRGRGYARQVTAAWAHHLQQRGKMPFYSHALNNLASQAVARSLGLIQFLATSAYS